MMRRCGAASLILFLPLALAAQTSAAPIAASSGGVATVAIPKSARKPVVCDGSEIRNFRLRRQWGTGIMIASLPVGLVSGMSVQAKPQSARQVTTGFVAGAAMLAIGGGLKWLGYPSESFYENAVARMRTGETRSAEVRTCLSAPAATSSGLRDEEWTYLTSRPGPSGHLKSLKLTFRDSVLVDIHRNEVDAKALVERLPIPSTPPTPVPVPRK